MSVKIRLSRIGKKHVPFYKLVVMDSRKKRDGAYLANIGTFDGLKGKIVVFHEELYQEWVGKGALPSDAAKKIYKLHKQQVKDQTVNAVGSAPKAA
jgi:small subunit ribosomal protein S16